jgi:MoaA/NifB/PqqE/SkfB family radical SAM enzyme/uncharacterized glyoxalase superfamily protein PhnB
MGLFVFIYKPRKIITEVNTMTVKKQATTAITRKAVRYLTKRPEKNFSNLMKVGKIITAGKDPFYGRTVKKFEDIWADKENPWRIFFLNFLTKLDQKQREKFAINFLVNSGIVGRTQQVKLEEEHGCNIPWAILMDPTSACNLRCTGCWAAEYEKQDELTYEEMSDIIRQCKELSCYFYLFSGGEPLLRKNDIIRLCEKYGDCIFGAFTNATLIDEEFAKDMQRVGNFFPIVSIEGFEEETDMRRGEGTYVKAVEAMDILKANNLAFGFSCCYHNKNVNTVASDEFIDFMIEKGAWFGWYFTFIPVGTDAPMELMVTPEQRALMYRRIRETRSKKPIFVLDFWNDGEYVDGCIAGGRRYFHINASGDAEPCAFIHFSDSNIRDKSILEILKSPLFMGYHDGQPFNSNMLRPCPLLDNPEKLRELVKKSGAASTQPLDPEDVDSLTAKCEEASKKWAEKADEIWSEKFGVFKDCAADIKVYK